MTDRETIGVVGVGWVGLVTAACFAEVGHEVRAMDVDEAKVEALRSGEVPIHEPGLPELVQRKAERLHFTTSMDEVLDAARLLFGATFPAWLTFRARSSSRRGRRSRTSCTRTAS